MKPKLPKAGQFYSYNGVLYRAKKGYSCEECSLNNPYSCPGIDSVKDPLPCRALGIILQKV